MTPRTAARSGSTWRDALCCDHLIFAFCFALFFVIALAGAVLGWHWRDWLPGAEGAKSIHGGVKAAVFTVMSQIE